MQITEKQMKEALKGGLNVIVIINGEYYDFVPEKNGNAKGGHNGTQKND